jgi:hypothetical protein
MKLNLTKHAKQRGRQRGFSMDSLQYIWLYGEIKREKRKGQKIFLTRKIANKKILELKWEIKNSVEPENIPKARKVIRALDNAAGKVIVEKNEKIITVFKKYYNLPYLSIRYNGSTNVIFIGFNHRVLQPDTAWH